MADETGASASAADAAGSSPAPSTASSEIAANGPAPATAAPATGLAQDPSGEPPKERWPDILAHARTKTEAEVTARLAQEYRTKYGWADQLQENPVGFYEWLHDQLASHPEHGPKILAKAGRALQSRRGQTAVSGPPERPKPDVPITDAHGNVTGYLYSDKQQDALDEWRWAQREATLNEKFAPLEALTQRIENAEHLAAIRDQADHQTTAVLADLRQQPYFKEHEAAIKTALIEHEDWGDNVYRAYTHVLTTQVLPTLSRTEQAKVLETLQQQAAGSTVNPRGSAPVQKPKFTSFAESARYYADHPEEAAAMANR